jgi:hypothetical protein
MGTTIVLTRSTQPAVAPAPASDNAKPPVAATEPPRPAGPPQIELPRADPFRPFADRGVKRTGSAPSEVLKLSGTLMSPKGPRAFINGDIFKVGDRVGGAVIKRIDESPPKVTLDRAGIEESLVVPEDMK